MSNSKAEVIINSSGGESIRIEISESNIKDILKYAIVQQPKKDTFIHIPEPK